jgi:hypothetical protein
MDNFFTDILPGGLGTSATSVAGTSQSSFLISLIRNGLILFFAVIVIAAIIYAANSGLKFIRSQGASDKVEEATEAIKYTLIGLGVAFLGVIAVIIVSGIFADGSDVSTAIDCFFELQLNSDDCKAP